MSEKLDRKLIEHMATDERDFGYIKSTMERIEKSQNKAETNHWAHVQESTGALQEGMIDLVKDVSALTGSVAELTADVGWIKKFFWIVAGSSVGALATGIFKFTLGE